MRAAGIHLYAGGYALGLRTAGFHMTDHLETSNFGKLVVESNLPGTDVHIVQEEWPTLEVDVIIGNPPCAPWSNAGKRQGAQDDRADDMRLFLDKCLEFGPDLFAFESVQGAIRTGFTFIHEMADKAIAAGYKVDLITYDNQHIGVPHIRRRFHFVASRFECDWRIGELPDVPTASELLEGCPTHIGPRPMNEGELLGWESSNAGEAIVRGFNRAMTELHGPLEEEWPRTERGHVRFRPGFLNRIVHPDRVCPTVMGTSTLMHWDEPRFLNVEEQKRAAGYPDDWWLPDNSTAYGLIGKAVMPLCGEWFGLRYLEALTRRVDVTPRLIIHDLERQVRDMQDYQLEVDLGL